MLFPQRPLTVRQTAAAAEKAKKRKKNYHAKLLNTILESLQQTAECFLLMHTHLKMNYRLDGFFSVRLPISSESFHSKNKP